MSRKQIHRTTKGRPSAPMPLQKPRIGDVVEIRTPAGLRYVQYTHDGGTSGQLVRVLPGLFANRPEAFSDLAQQREQYFVFYTLDYALRADDGAEVVSNQPIPDWARPYPMMRHSAATDETGRTIRWRIISAASRLTPEELQRAPILTDLTTEQEGMSIRETWPHRVLARELARGWTPERAEHFRLKDNAEEHKQKAVHASTAAAKNQRMSHYLYFPDKANAEKAAQWFRSQGFSVETKLGADGENWLTLVKQPQPPDAAEMEKVREEMEALASQLHGEYDGWELAI